MNETAAPRRLLHVCLRSLGVQGSLPNGNGSDESQHRGTLLSQARLNDQQRLAVVFQGAALMAHLEHGGFYLTTGEAASAWEDATIDPAGRLQVGDVHPGSAADLPQTFMRQLLLIAFQSENTVAGRGTARRIARRLLELWHHRLTPISPDLAVMELLSSAEYLWSPSFAEARKALVGEHLRGEDRHPWVVGPGRARRLFLRRAAAEDEITRAGLESLAASGFARELWDGFEDDPDADPWQLYEQGRWQHAAALWRRASRRTKAETLAFARCLRATGRSSEALALLQRRRDVEGLLLKATCQLDLEERPAADKTVHLLLEQDLEDLQLVAVAEIHIRLAAARYQHQVLRKWIAKMLSLTSQPARSGGLVVAAGAAFDVGDFPAMGRYLDQTEDPETLPPDLAVQWHQLEGLRRWQAGDGPGSVEHLTRALSMHRRKLHLITAARLWNDLALARESTGDLAGAEHACRHSLRLFARCEGRAQNTLGLYNLAELRVRQGLLRGVADILERSTADNRLTGNKRGLAHDLELWARYELAQGRPTAALARCAEARQSGEVCNQANLDVLAARAHGWLGETQQAEACLNRHDPEALDILDPEERPAAWALAGRFDDACRLTEGTPWQEPWASLAAGLHPPSVCWAQLDTLDPFRSARLIFDLETLMPGVVPPARLRRALELLRKRRLAGFVEVLEQRATSPWMAITEYLGRDTSLGAIAELLQNAGYGEASLSLEDGDQTRVLVAGKTEARNPRATRYRVMLESGALTLEADEGRPDPVLEALFSLVARDLGRGSETSNGTSLAEMLEAATAVGQVADVNDPNAHSGHGAKPDHSGIIGESPALRDALRKIDRLARGDLPILILGESGTGKELAARRAHRSSLRNSGPFLPLNCAAISESLIQSTLFGHVRGAFTGADQNRAGIFESARGGTVFLDEIGDLPLAVQGNLLRVLQEGEIRRVGDTLARKVDVRIVAATHRDLAKMVDEGSFRQDLYFRLRVAKVVLPALRDRDSDLILLAEFFALRERGTRISASARKALSIYTWPGNIRELESVVRVAATYSDFEVIRTEHLADAGIPIDESISEEPASPAPGPSKDYHQLVEEYRKELVSTALQRHGKNQSAAARDLGMTRQALSYLARKLGLL